MNKKTRMKQNRKRTHQFYQQKNGKAVNQKSKPSAQNSPPPQEDYRQSGEDFD